ncbi:MAG: hypothetical protein RQ729_02645 [Wenzhouxiangellaceae bacterium]|nr:hypothetical protein [Wenzhouxiangellaceae bacterium]
MKLQRYAEPAFPATTIATRKVDDFRHFGNNLVNPWQTAVVPMR